MRVRGRVVLDDKPRRRPDPLPALRAQVASLERRVEGLQSQAQSLGLVPTPPRPDPDAGSLGVMLAFPGPGIAAMWGGPTPPDAPPATHAGADDGSETRLIIPLQP